MAVDTETFKNIFSLINIMYILIKIIFKKIYLKEYFYV